MTRKAQVHVAAARSGFTLVEMLVAVGLVVLMMSLFAQIFVLATGSMQVHRGAGENDQRARAVFTILRNDLAHLTYQPLDADNKRGLRPLAPGDTPDSDRQQGYFYYSENDLNNDLDDVLQFTTLLSDDEPRYSGRAAVLDANIQANPNQPEGDDGQILVADGTGSSRAAEIAYFVRNGILYRRVLLIRQPLSSSYDSQPASGANGLGTHYLNAAYTGEFWQQFDYSAGYDIATGAVHINALGTAAPSGLDNANGTNVYALGLPWNRFGHNYCNRNFTPGNVNARAGHPREYVFDTSDANTLYYIGRFTQEETSDPDFDFPARLPTPNPMNPNDGLTVLNGSNVFDGTLEAYRGGSRQGEDILLSNVHGFDVKVWDDILGEFVDIGHNRTDSGNPVGIFNRRDPTRADIDSGNLNPSYGPRTPDVNPLTDPQNRIFDTWHTSVDMNGDGTGDPPPYRPKYNTANVPDWTADTDYALNTFVKSASAPSTVVFAVVIAGRSSNSAVPAWGSAKPGDRFVDNTVVWEARSVDIPLKAIQVTVRFLDVSSNQMRQVTLMHAFVRD